MPELKSVYVYKRGLGSDVYSLAVTDCHDKDKVVS